MPLLEPGAVTDATTLPLDHAPASPEQTIDGTPTIGTLQLDTVPGGRLGVWEITPGVVRDVEIDEVFLVISGSATVEFIEPARDAVDLRPGVVVKLVAGMRTIWTVRETLRKIYIASTP